MVSLSPLDILVIAFYLLVLICVGVFVSYRRRREDDQFLAGRSFGWFNVGLSIFGTNVSPSFLIASASAAYSTGIVTANFEWLAWLFLMLLAMVFTPQVIAKFADDIFSRRSDKFEGIIAGPFHC